MTVFNDIPEIVFAVQQALNTSLHAKTATEFAGPCPKCGGEDRFVVFTDGKPRFWCRGCGWKGFVDSVLTITPEQQAQFAQEAQRRNAEYRVLAEQALKNMHTSTDHEEYYGLLLQHPEKIAYWTEEGITLESIHHFKLGWCPQCPMSPQHASFTIPIFRGGLLINIRHRLERATADKYRPHAKYLPRKCLFNVDEANQARTGILVEGSKKAIVLRQLGYTAAAIMGKENYDAETLQAIRHWDPFYVALDPDALESATDIAKIIGSNAAVVKTVLKIDDMIVQYGCSKADIDRMLHLGRRIVRDKRNVHR